MHAISRTDPFSITMSGHPWYAWEWLYDLLIATIHGWMGLNGVVFFSALIIAATFSFVFFRGLKNGGGLPLTVLLLVFAIGAGSIHFLARPHLLGLMFSIIWFCLLDSDFSQPEHPHFHRIFWYPLLMLFWVNMHGGFLLGFVLVALYAMGVLIQHFAGAARDFSWQKLKRLGAVTLLSFAASLLNPFSYKLYLHIYGYLTNRFLMDHIDEFLSPNFHGAAQQCFAALLLIALASIAAGKNRLNPARLLVLIFAAYAGLYSSRNLPVSSLLLVLIIAPLLSAQISSASGHPGLASSLRSFCARLTDFSRRLNEIETRRHAHVWPALAVIFGIIICMNGGRLGKHQWMNSQLSSKRFPVEATKFIVEQGMRDPVFCPDYWGGYLIYRLYPRSKVFIDDRHDLYGQTFLEQYLKILHVSPEWEEVLDSWKVNWVLAPAQSSLANILRESPQWSSDYEDGTAVLFKRNQKI